MTGDSILVRSQTKLAGDDDLDDQLEDEQRGRLDFLCFILDGEEYGVDLNLVRQIVKPPPLTWVPRVDPHILGVISIRGAVVTLVDLRQLMAMEPSELPRGARVLIVDRDDEQIGLLVDGVTQVRRLGIQELEHDLAFEESRRTEHLLYLARPAADQIVVVLDLEGILLEMTK
jgi:purine-binding chemotaxis protein CheW